jgi:hypothetical protein
MTNSRAWSVLVSIIRKGLAFIIVVLFTVSVTITLLLYAITVTISNTENWQAIFTEIRFPERSRVFLANILISYSLQTREGGSILGGFQMQSWESVAEYILPISWLEENLNNITFTYINWLGEKDTPLPDITLDLAPVLNVLSGPEGQLAILPLLQGFPTCSSDVKLIVIMGDNLINCLPENLDLTDIAHTIARLVANALPKKITINSLQEDGLINAEVYNKLNRTRLVFQMFKGTLSLGLRFSFLLLCLYGLLHSTSLKRVLETLSLPLYTSAGLSLVTIGVWYIFVAWGLGLFVTVNFPAINVDAQALLVDMVRAISTRIEKYWLFGTVFLLLVAFVLHMLMFGYSKLQNRRVAKVNMTSQRQSSVRKQFR